MKIIPLLALIFTLSSCSKKSGSTVFTKNDSSKIIESINASRTKYNDSIKNLNVKNIFDDLSGTHSFKFAGEEASFSGNIKFSKSGRDEYDVTGKAVLGANKVSISGMIRRVSKKHLNFEGKIAQTINGKKYIRTRRTTFFDEGIGSFWRLQDKVNGDGFVDYIDIGF